MFVQLSTTTIEEKTSHKPTLAQITYVFTTTGGELVKITHVSTTTGGELVKITHVSTTTGHELVNVTHVFTTTGGETPKSLPRTETKKAVLQLLFGT